jgi:hypothetical protein
MERWCLQYGSDTTEVHPISDVLGEYVIADVDPDNNYCAEKREIIARLIAAAPDLLEMCKLTIGFCVDFRQNKDWQNHPEIGILYAKAKLTLAKAEIR